MSVCRELIEETFLIPLVSSLCIQLPFCEYIKMVLLSCKWKHLVENKCCHWLPAGCDP